MDYFNRPDYSDMAMNLYHSMASVQTLLKDARYREAYEAAERAMRCADHALSDIADQTIQKAMNGWCYLR